MVYLLIFVLGLIGGSFLNSFIYSLEKDKPITRVHSECPKCGHSLGVFDLVPLLSFIFLKGKCKYCGKRISTQYPLVEAGTGALFVLTFLKFFQGKITFFSFTEALLYFLLMLVFVVIFTYDLKHFLIPDRIVFLAIGIAVLIRLLSFLEGGSGFKQFGLAFLSGFLGALFLALIHFGSKGEWMGFGDVKLAFFMGVLLGPAKFVLAFFVANLLGAVAGGILIFFSKKNLKSKIPFGPFLVAGTLVSLFLGEAILSLYFGLLML